MKRKIGSLVFALTIVGCATDPNNQLNTIQNELDQVQQQKSQLEAKVSQSNQDIQRLSTLNRQLTSAQQAAASAAAAGSTSGDLLPPNAKAGECYARVLTPAMYRTESKEVIKKEAGYRLEVTNPVYETITERVLVKEESEIAELVPAKYDWRVESVLIKDAYEVLKTIPATYDTRSEKILVKAAYTTWKKGRGPIEKVSNATGEIMCLVEVPAEYRTVSSRIVVAPPRTERASYPAVYKDVKKRVMIEGPTMVKRTIPAAYKTIKVRKLVKPAAETRIEIPAIYQTITNRIKTTDSFLEWRSILCETNTTGDIVASIQRALLTAGHNPGSIDGVIGSQTMQAVKSYQQAKNLAVGQLTFETLKSLGVSYKY